MVPEDPVAIIETIPLTVEFNAASSEINWILCTNAPESNTLNLEVSTGIKSEPWSFRLKDTVSPGIKPDPNKTNGSSIFADNLFTINVDWGETASFPEGPGGPCYPGAPDGPGLPGMPCVTSWSADEQANTKTDSKTVNENNKELFIFILSLFKINV